MNVALDLTPDQRAMVFHALVEPCNEVDVQQVVVTLEASPDATARVDAATLERAWHAVIARHPMLHSRVIDTEAGDYRLQTVPGFQPALLVVDIVAPDDHVAPEVPLPGYESIDHWLATDRAHGFDIFAQPPSRLTLLRQPGRTDRCAWSFHRIVLDGRGVAEVLAEVWDAYDAALQGASAPVVVRPTSDGYHQWLHGRDPAPSTAYWRNLLAGIDQATPFPVSALVDAPGRATVPSASTASTAAPAATATRPRVVERSLGKDETASLERWATASGGSLDGLVQAAWATVLARHVDQAVVVFGVVRDGRTSDVADADRVLGVFTHTVPVRADVDQCSGVDLVGALCGQQRRSRPHQYLPLAQMHASPGVGRNSALFHTVVTFEHEDLDARMHRLRPGWVSRHFALHAQSSYPVALHAHACPQLTLRLAWADEALTAQQAERVAGHLLTVLRGIVAQPARAVRTLAMLTDDELRWLDGQCNATDVAVAPITIHAAFAQAVAAHPQQPALTGAGRTLSYAELDAASDTVAAALAAHGVRRGAVVGLGIDRSLELVIGMLGILKAGAAYLPLDPAYPAERTLFCLQDSQARFVLTQRRHAPRFNAAGVSTLLVEDIVVGDTVIKDGVIEDTLIEGVPVDDNRQPGHAGVADARGAGSADDLAYTIYTSGSTGQPKGVLVTHANVANFFAGMDAVIDTAATAEKRWLAVTSASFDISVLELLWTLTRGFEVVVHGARDLGQVHANRGPSFSLFHFASGMDAADPQPYRLIIEAARFADRHGFEAVWSPERHFHDFGAPYPNPSVISAALATITSRVQLRAGSVVLPLHDPRRVAEEWSLVDQLSGGRVGVSFASGWQPNDFVLAPGNYADRKTLMFEQIDTVRALWRGERVKAINPNGDEVLLGTYPRPVQAELPIWITAAGSPDTFRQAGAIGANILTHLLGQSLGDLGANIRAYRDARAAAGLDPATGRVTVMVHTFIGDDSDAVREQVREPMQRYLRSAASLVGGYADAWAAFKRGAGGHVGATAISELSPDEQHELYDFAFERYFESSGLLGSVDKCAALVESLRGLGVDEIACLIDFGVAADTVIAHLPYIDQLQRHVGQDLPGKNLLGKDWLGKDVVDKDVVDPDTVSRGVQDEADGLVATIARHAITHLQCTPSLAGTIPMLVSHRDELASLRQLLIGGEALPHDLVAELHGWLPASAGIVNLYGPTETTVWSTSESIARGAQHITIGRPIANTQCHVLDSCRQRVPPGCIGELHIGGDGVTRGYHQRPELNAGRFFELAVGARVQRVYATGDLVRQLPDGRLEYLGRNDLQVKVRGHRIEPGEIEIALRAQPGVADAVVVVPPGASAAQVLVGYLVAARGMGTVETEALKAALRRRLPEHMVPNAFVWLEALPLTPNGKIDRQALPPWGDLALVAPVAPAARVATPRSDAEQVIREIWERVLNVADIGVRDNFFELGGHSILAVKVQSELSRAFGFRLPIVELFRSPTIEALAAHFAHNPATGGTAAGQGMEKATRRTAAMHRRVALIGGRSHDDH